MQCHPDNFILYSFSQLFLCRQLYSLRHRQNLTLVKSICETVAKSLFWAFNCVPGFKSWWPVKKAIVDLPIRMTGNSKWTSGNLLSLSGAHNTDVSAALQTLRTRVKWCLWCRLTSLRHRYLPKTYTTVKIQHN